jgi:hypothetical protein
MRIANALGLGDELFCKMMVKTKMFGMVAVLGHSAEIRYEKFLRSKNIEFEKASNDEHFDYTVKGKRNQVKRFETGRTTLDKLVANLTKTHGNRSGGGTGDVYFKTDFDNLVILDFDGSFHTVKVDDITEHRRRPNQLSGSHTIHRDISPTPFQKDFLYALKEKNEKFPPAIEILKEKYNITTYSELWQKISNLTLEETDSLFSVENFRLITAAKGFAAEEHFNMFLEQNEIEYEQNIGMYAKSDHIVNGVGFQVKTTYPNGTTRSHWAFKTHKSHGHGETELYKNDAFDMVAVFVGYEPQEKAALENLEDRYTPTSTTTSFIFIPITDLDDHPNHPGHLKRVSKVPKDRYTINDTSIF